MKNSIFVGMMVLSSLAAKNSLAASACDLVPSAQNQLNSCSASLSNLQASLASLKTRESELANLLRQDQGALKAACERDLRNLDDQTRDLDRRVGSLIRERDFLTQELRRLDQATYNRGVWECVSVDLRGGYATLGNGRSQDEARRDAKNKGDFKGHQDYTECYLLLQDPRSFGDGPRNFTPDPDERSPRDPRDRR